ncbi:hypothetical protein ACH46_15505 [Gordonia phthalatica]|uniref:Mce-associated membrane protein n=2 Tax=Gordonia phthalatica TaxID=1136941 RepID=A0A0N9NB51_9ACTN|nr:hypothetical protein ACH46_15505 [Gordonia phthalatica]
MIAAPIAVVCAIAAVVVAVLAGTGRFDPAESAETAADQVMTRAEEIVCLPFTYSAATWDADLARTAEVLTGPAKRQWNAMSESNGRVIRESDVIAECTVDRLALEKLDEPTAKLLAHLKVHTRTNGTSNEPTFTSTRVTLTRVDGRWLLSEFAMM